ncbi:MAG: hypothetical protein PVI80_02785 [Anaerolineae bacterium]|jgi:hypothetical protein
MRFNRKSVALAAVILVVALSLAVLSPVIQAQDYRFNLAENRVDLYINGDGTAQIIYDLTFVNDPSARPIDAVDVGMPNSTYNLSEVRASINGVPLTDISNSPYVTPGVAVELGSQAIPPGGTGTLHLEATVRDLIYQDSEDSEYASLEFAPTWFDSEFVYGPTRLEVNFHLPPGVTADEPRYHDREFTEAYFEDDRVVYSWVDGDARGDREYVFGASFPQIYLAEGVVQKAPAFNFDLSGCCSSPVVWFLAFGIGWAVLAFAGNRAQKRRRMKYMPPALAVEGTGVKRGLTAVEAAILLEAPLDRVVTMILFGLVKKGIVTVESEKPLKLQVADPSPKDVKLWYYERRFLDAVLDDGKLGQKALREMIIDLIGDVNKKMTGFSRAESKAYYKDIAARAWKQVEAADTPEVLGKRWGEGLEWTMLEDDWDDRTRRVFHDRPVVLPHWWWFYRPWGASTAHARPSTPMPTPSGGGTPVTLPTLPGADFANTVVTGIENTANTVVSGVDNFTSRITQSTNPPPKSSSSSSRGGGGYSCACACACAGCACACAGGGR